MRRGFKVGRVWPLAFVVAATLLAGCSSGSVEQRRVAPYRPDMSRRNVSEWVSGDRAESGAPGEDLIVHEADSDDEQSVESGISSWSRVFRSGDRVIITLSGIPVPMERQDVVDDTGQVSLPFVGGIVIEGKTPSEAKRMIEQAYIDGGYYRSITATIVAQEEEFYVRGEVRRPGRHPWRSGMTLTQAIIAAGGYTDFARPGQVQLNRKEVKSVYDVRRIDAGRDRDPPLEPGDTIIVGRRWFL